MEKSAVFKVAGTIKPEIPKLGNMLAIPYGYGVIPDPGQCEFESAEEVIEFAAAVTDLSALIPEGTELEWNTVDGWEFISNEPEIIQEYCEPYLNDLVEENEQFHDIFHEAVLNEYVARPKVFSRVSVDDLVEHWRPKYRIISGFFELVPTSQPSAARATTEMW